MEILIEKLLKLKPHNEHYLNRYLRCIESWKDNHYLLETESHHICPKATDLFPQYKSFRENPWNRINLTYRQHFIAHWLLWKAYGGSQTIAFAAMQNQNSSRGNIVLKSSRTFARLRKEAYTLMSEKNKGYAVYKDKFGSTVRCMTTDPRVKSGELISTTVGRKYKIRSTASRLKTSKAISGKQKGKPRWTVAERIQMRKIKEKKILYFDFERLVYEECDPLLASSSLVRASALREESKPIYNIEGKFRRIRKDIPFPPEGWYFKKPNNVAHTA